MKIKDLIEILKELDSDIVVSARNSDGEYYVGEEVYASVMLKDSYSEGFPSIDICLITSL